MAKVNLFEELKKIRNPRWLKIPYDGGGGSWGKS